jgi:hypothetical protein
MRHGFLYRCVVGFWFALAPLSAWSAPASAPNSERAVADFLAAWSGRGGIDGAAVSRLYAERVVYYGRLQSRSQVLAQKQAIATRWPSRSYRAAPGVDFHSVQSRKDAMSPGRRSDVDSQRSVFRRARVRTRRLSP